MGVGFFKHFKPKKNKDNVEAKIDKIPAKDQALTLAEEVNEKDPEKYTILSYGQKPSLEQIQAANKKWFNNDIEADDDKCEDLSEKRHDRIRFSEPLVTFVIAADKYDRTTTTSTVFSQIQFLGEMAEMQEQEKRRSSNENEIKIFY